MHAAHKMHLVARRAQAVHLAGQHFDCAAGDRLHTASPYKYSVEGFRALAAPSGFVPEAVWRDPQRLCSAHWLKSKA